MTTYPSYWDVDADGLWSNASDWWTYVPGQPGSWQHVIPGVDDDVNLTPTDAPNGTSVGTSPYTLTYSATATINSLTGPAYATFAITGGSLTVATSLNLQGPLNISKGLLDIQNGGGVSSYEGGLGDNNAYLPSLDLTGGTLEIDAGALVLTGANTIAGGVVRGAGNFYVGGYGSLAIDAGASITAATFELGVAGNGTASSTTLNTNFFYNGNFLLDDYSGNNAVLNLNGYKLSLSGTAGFSGTINGPGTLWLTKNETATFSPPNYAGFYALGGISVVNYGTVNEQDNFQLDGSFDNAAGGVYNFTTDGGVNNQGSVTFTNEGALNKTGGTGVSTIYGAFTTTGVVDVETGAIAALGSGGALSGTIKGAGEFEIEYNGVYTLSSTLSLTVSSFGIDNTDGNGGGAAELIFTKDVSYGGAFYAGSVFADTDVDLAGDTLTLSGSATFTAPYGSVNLTGGGLLSFAKGATAAIDSTNFNGGVDIDNAGTITDNGNIYLDSDGSSKATQLDNLSTGVIDIGDVQNALIEGGTAALITNAGKIDKTAGTGDSDVKVVINSTGTLEADTGALWLFNGGSIGGNLMGGGDITLRGAAAYSLTSTVNLTVANFSIGDSATVTLGKSLTYGGVFYEGGTFSSTQLKLAGFTLTLQGSATFTAAYGSVNIKGGAVVLAKTSTSEIDDTNLAGGVTLRNWGTLTDDLNIILDSDGGLAQTLLNNEAGGVIDINGDGNALGANGVSALVVNAGKIDKTAGVNDSDIRVVVNTTGTLEADTGALWLFNGGSIGGNLMGAGDITLRGAAAYSLTSTLNLTVADFTITDSATITLGKSLAYGGVFYEGGTFTNTQLKLAGFTLTLQGSATFTAAYGYVTIKGGSVVLAKTSTTEMDDTNLAGGATLNNWGTLTDNLYVHLDSDGGVAQSLLHNEANAVININGDGPAFSANGSSALIINAGKIDKTAGTGVSAIAVTVENDSVLRSDTGDLDLQDAVTGTGSDAIAMGAAIEFDASVSAGQTVVFKGANAALDLNDFGGFAGTISGFDKNGAGDVINVLGPWTWVGFSENASHTQGSMTFANGSIDFSVTLLGNYVAGNFVPTSGNNVTQVTYT